MISIFTRCRALLCSGLISCSSASLANCNTDHSVFAYIPLIVTAPASIVVTAAGYTVDGVYYMGGPIAVGAAICIPIGVVVGGQSGGDIAGRCISGFLQDANFSVGMFGESNLGSSAYVATRSWRCPF